MEFSTSIPYYRVPRMFANFEVSFILRVQQVADLFVVNFNVRDFDGEFDVGVRVHFGRGAVEELGTRLRYNSFIRSI